MKKKLVVRDDLTMAAEALAAAYRAWILANAEYNNLLAARGGLSQYVVTWTSGGAADSQK